MANLTYIGVPQVRDPSAIVNHQMYIPDQTLDERDDFPCCDQSCCCCCVSTPAAAACSFADPNYNLCDAMYSSPNQTNFSFQFLCCCFDSGANCDPCGECCAAGLELCFVCLEGCCGNCNC